jgi:hypothetical protein
MVGAPNPLIKSISVDSSRADQEVAGAEGDHLTLPVDSGSFFGAISHALSGVSPVDMFRHDAEPDSSNGSSSVGSQGRGGRSKSPSLFSTRRTSSSDGAGRSVSVGRHSPGILSLLHHQPVTDILVLDNPEGTSSGSNSSYRLDVNADTSPQFPGAAASRRVPSPAVVPISLLRRPSGPLDIPDKVTSPSMLQSLQEPQRSPSACGDHPVSPGTAAVGHGHQGHPGRTVTSPAVALLESDAEPIGVGGSSSTDHPNHGQGLGEGRSHSHSRYDRGPSPVEASSRGHSIYEGTDGGRSRESLFMSRSESRDFNNTSQASVVSTSSVTHSHSHSRSPRGHKSAAEVYASHSASIDDSFRGKADPNHKHKTDKAEEGGHRRLGTSFSRTRVAAPRAGKFVSVDEEEPEYMGFEFIPSESNDKDKDSVVHTADMGICEIVDPLVVVADTVAAAAGKVVVGIGSPVVGATTAVRDNCVVS